MNTLTIDHKNGHFTNYKLVNDGSDLQIAYNLETPEKLIDILERCRRNKIRVKFNFGDTTTGKSWNEENDTVGYIGLSRGRKARFPILVHNKSSFGGGSLSTDRILQIKESKGKRILYQTENFAPSKIEVRENCEEENYKYSLVVEGNTYSNHKTEKQAIALLNKLS